MSKYELEQENGPQEPQDSTEMTPVPSSGVHLVENPNSARADAFLEGIKDLEKRQKAAEFARLQKEDPTLAAIVRDKVKADRTHLESAQKGIAASQELGAQAMQVDQELGRRQAGAANQVTKVLEQIKKSA